MTQTSTVDHAACGRRRPVLLALVIAVLGMVGLVGPLAEPAAAQGRVATFDVAAVVRPGGSVTVRQHLTFAGAVPETVSEKLELRENLVGDRQYVQHIGEVTAAADGRPLPVNVSKDDPYATIRVTTGGAGPVEISYTVTGAVVRGQAGPILRLRLLQGLSAPVAQFTATVAVPGFTYLRCTSGPPNSTTPCGSAAGGTESARIPTFRDGPRGAGEIVAVEIGLPAGAVTANEDVAHRWSARRAFSASPLPLGVALGVLVAGGLALLWLQRRAAARGGSSTPSAEGGFTPVGEFAPVAAGQSEFRAVEAVRPGQIGTVLDERVDPIDVSATLLDLAVRGHLLITELPRESEYAPVDWMLSRETGGSDYPLRQFERRLLDGICAEGGEVRVSGLGDKVRVAIEDVQSDLYDDVVHAGWFARRPDATRRAWTWRAVGVLVLAAVAVGLLAAFTTWGLVGAALVLLALGLLFVVQALPDRTAAGASLLAGLGALRSQLLTHPTDQMPPGQELHELSKVLPYAVVLGGADRWLAAIAGADTDAEPDATDLSWYHGPPSWHLRDLPLSLRNFLTTVSGTLFAR